MKSNFPQERDPKKKKSPPVGSGMIKKTVDVITSRKSRLDAEIDRQSGGKKK